MPNKFEKISLALIITSFPYIVFAQLTQTKEIFNSVKDIITTLLIPLAFALAILFFFWSVAIYTRSIGSEKEEGKRIMIWGVIALFVMSSIWGIVRLLQQELSIGIAQSNISIPTISGGSDINSSRFAFSQNTSVSNPINPISVNSGNNGNIDFNNTADNGNGGDGRTLDTAWNALETIKDVVGETALEVGRFVAHSLFGFGLSDSGASADGVIVKKNS